MQILYVEDSRQLRDAVTRGLKKSGYVVTAAEDGNTGLDLALTGSFDVIILDVMLPGVNGFEILNQLKKSNDCDAEILMLTARVAIEDRVHGLNAGADDYLVKPFAFDELLARVRVLMRRRYARRTNSLTFGSITVDLGARRAFSGKDEVVLRPREFDVLEYLALRQGSIVSRNEIVEHVYDHAVDLKSNAVDSAICNLRKSLAQAGCDNCIQTIPRRGYLFEIVDE